MPTICPLKVKRIMEGGNLRLRYPGLVVERLPSGSMRWRVRVEGRAGRKIALPCGPEHAEFHRYYQAARRGLQLDPPREITHEPGTMGWLFSAYLKHLERMVANGQASPLTLKERRNLTKFVLGQQSEQARSLGRFYAELPMTIPDAELIAFRDRMGATPGKARNVWKLLRAAYDFGMQRGHCRSNPARAVARPIYVSQGGATPWTMADLEAYRAKHPPGTAAHLTLTLFMFTACRIGDAVILGREHEERHSGRLWLAWQPRKKGSRRVQIPVLPPLERALKARTVLGPTYLLTSQGVPFRSGEGLRNRLAKWCEEAGIVGRSSHGIRKAAGHLLALHGATQYEIMAVHGHANASTSQVYTETVERMRLGDMAASKLAGMDW